MTIDTPEAHALEVLDTARHEAGHVLAYWWNGWPPEAVEMRRHEEGRPRLTSRGAEIAPTVRACVIGGVLLDEWALSDPEPFAGRPPEIGRELVARDLLGALAGAAVEWRNERDPESLPTDLAGLLESEPAACDGDREHVEALLALLPEDERPEALAAAWRRAAVLVCRYWPELCALADRLATAERLEDEALAAVLSETLGGSGGVMGWRRQPLEALDLSARLGDADVVAWWKRDAVDVWRLAAAVDGLPLSLPLEVAHLSAEELEDEPEPCAPGWYCLDHAAGVIHAGPPPAVGTLRQFLAGLVADKLEELRRDPDHLSTPEATQ